MSGDLLQTKLYAPRIRPSLVPRPRLIERLNQGLQTGGKLTLISAPAGFGKTTLVREWVGGCERPFAWLSLDERDNDLIRFLVYFIAALQTLSPEIGKRTSRILESSQQPPPESILTILLNEIVAIPEGFVLVLDDYHALDAQPIDQALTFLLEHQPPQMHLVIATREDPSLPLARLSTRGQLTEVRAADLRFTPAEAAEFLNRVMGLNLSEGDIAALEARTEGWIAGLQLAALSMQAHPDTASFIKSFTGSHHFVMDYRIDEVLGQQPENIQIFLLRTSILDRLCGPLCDAVLLDPSTSGQEVLEHLERTNLFIVPLDNERRWYRYHHLFGDLLRQRLGQPQELPDYYLRAGAWYETNADLAQAFHHALAAGDFDWAARLAEAATDLGQRTNLVDWPHRWNLAQARLKESDGEWDSALDLLDTAGLLYIKNPIPILQPIAARKARVFLKQWRLDKAQVWTQERGFSVTDEANYLGEYEYLTLARVRLVEGSFNGVSDEIVDF